MSVQSLKFDVVPVKPGAIGQRKTEVEIAKIPSDVDLPLLVLDHPQVLAASVHSC
jgi:hypothetical protein